MAFLYHIFVSYFEKGGPLMYLILGVSLVAWFLGLNKLGFLIRFSKAHKRYRIGLDEVLRTGEYVHTTGIVEFDDLLRHVCETRKRSGTAGAIELCFREFLISAMPVMNRSFSTISAWISVAPLLGLLGTVGGMIETFRVITNFGLGNPNLTAEGISIALITTQAGLTVAFPGVILHNFLVNKSRSLTASLLKDGEDLVNSFVSSSKLPDGVNEHV